jgi:vacuolar-type H+-ATPase subunit H
MAEYPPKLTAERAINRVLQAERDAREAMLECDRQTDQALREARERARRIRERAEERIQHWYLNSDQRTAARLRDLDEQAQALRADPPEPSGLTREWQLAVQELTDELIGRSR